jgi:hypothetical protein
MVAAAAGPGRRWATGWHSPKSAIGYIDFQAVVMRAGKAGIAFPSFANGKATGHLSSGGVREDLLSGHRTAWLPVKRNAYLFFFL